MIARRPGAQAGFSLTELMIALGLSSMVALGVISLVRSQLVAYELNDSVMKAQQNARAGVEFLEMQLRRSCGGLSEGLVAINVPGQVPSVKGCVQFWNSAIKSGGTFLTSGTTGTDAIEVISQVPNESGSYTSAKIITGFGTTTPSLTVTDMSGFSVGDLVLITDFKRGNLFQIATINGGAGPAAGVGPFTFGSLPGASINAPGYTPTVGDAVVKAVSIAIYVVPGVAPDPATLYLDPDGMVGTAHTDEQPLVDGIADFQLAFGLDWQVAAPATGTANDGVLAEAAAPSLNNDEWVGNVAGEVLPAPTLALPWNPSPPGAPLLRQIRSTLVVRTTSAYPSPLPNFGPFENGAAITAAVASGRSPRYRIMRSVVAPRVWNVGE